MADKMYRKPFDSKKVKSELIKKVVKDKMDRQPFDSKKIKSGMRRFNRGGKV